MKTGARGTYRAVGKPGTAIQFQRRELVAVPALPRFATHTCAHSRLLPDGPSRTLTGLLPIRPLVLVSEHQFADYSRDRRGPMTAVHRLPWACFRPSTSRSYRKL